MISEIAGDVQVGVRGEAPRLREGTARATVAGRLFIGHERIGKLAALDPVASILVASLDGATELPDLARDVAAVSGQGLRRADRYVRSLVGELARVGFLDGPLPADARARRIDVRVEPTSCLGQRWALSEAETLQIGGNDGFRVSCTIPGLLRPIEELLLAQGELVEPDFDLMDTLHLRATLGRRPRTQLLFDTLDPIWFACRSLETAAEALRRSIQGRLAMRQGDAWLAGPTIQRDGRIVLVHPSVWPVVTSVNVRRSLRALGCELTRGGLLRTDGCTAELPADVVEGGGVVRLAPAGIATPEPFGEFEHIRQCLHLLRWWDGTGFRAATMLAERLPEVPVGELGPDQLAAEVSRCLAGQRTLAPFAGPE